MIIITPGLELIHRKDHEIKVIPETSEANENIWICKVFVGNISFKSRFTKWDLEEDFIADDLIEV